jgi:hypothetical protein
MQCIAVSWISETSMCEKRLANAEKAERASIEKIPSLEEKRAAPGRITDTPVRTESVYYVLPITLPSFGSK